jgi:hypothetical protein
MPRLEVILGEMPQPKVGAIHSSYESFGAGWKPQRAESRIAGFVPPKPRGKRPCCKTCNDRGCVGHCKF